MHFGVSMFHTDYSIPAVQLARALEDRAFESMWAPEQPTIASLTPSPLFRRGGTVSSNPLPSSEESRAKTGRLWTYVRDEFAETPPAGSDHLSCSATLSSPAWTHGSSTPGEPETPTPAITSSPSLTGNPPGMAMTLGKVTCWRTTGSRWDAARRIGSFKLFGDFVEPGLDARLVDAGRAGDADSGNNLVAEFNRQPAGCYAPRADDFGGG